MIESGVSKTFGKKEKVLNYTCQTYQLSRPAKVGSVMALIRECQPKNFDEREKYYFMNAYTDSKIPSKIDKEGLIELGERLYTKITEIVIPEWTEAFKNVTLEDCQDYIYNLTLNRTYDGYIREKSVVFDTLQTIFPEVVFEESDPELDHAGDIDFLGKYNNFAFGLQIKPVTAKSNFGSYSVSDRMKNNFSDFKDKYGGNVFIVYSIKGELQNKDVIDLIKNELNILQKR